MSESNERSETGEQASSASASDGSTVEAFRKALMAEDSGESQEGDADESRQSAKPQEGEPGGKPKGKPKAFDDVAERLGVDVKDLYGVELTTGKGKKVTLGSLKDLADKSEDFEVRETQFAERVAKQEAEWTRAQTEFAELMSLVDPKAIKPELRDKVRQKVDADVKRERELVLKTIPEWQDQTVREAELGAMVEFLKDFGIHESFLSATMNHKLFRLVRYATLQKQRIARALAKVETIKKPSTTGKGAPHGAPKKPATSSSRSSRPSDTRSQFETTLRASE